MNFKMVDKNRSHSNEEYELLWKELEPRLKSRSRRRGGVIVLFGLGILLIITLATYVLKEKPSINMVDNGVMLLEKPMSEAIAIESPDTRTESASKESERTENSAPSVDDKESFSGFDVQEPPSKNIGLESLANQGLFSSQKYSSTVVTTQLSHLNSRPENIDPSSKEAEYKLYDRETSLQILPLVKLTSEEKSPLSFYRTEVHQPLLENAAENKFSLQLSYDALLPFSSIIAPESNYSEDLQNSLNMIIAMAAELKLSYAINQRLYIGLGLSYTHIWEQFDIDNRVTKMQLVNNSQAFVHMGNFKSAEQLVPVHTTQRVRKNNTFKIYSLVPQIAKSFEMGKIKYRCGAGLPVIISQSYAGTLFDEDRLVTSEHEILSVKKFSKVGLQLELGVGYSISERIDLGIRINYKRFFAGNDDYLDYSQPSIQALGIGVSSKYRFSYK